MFVRPAILASAALLVAGAVAAAVFTALWTNNGDSKTSRAPNRFVTRTALSNALATVTALNTMSTVINAAGKGDLESLSVTQARLGDEIVVTGSDWTNTESPVRFYLLTEEEADLKIVLPSDTVRLGEAEPDEQGVISFQFRLEQTYETPGGRQVDIREGEKWVIMACQATEPAAGLRGSHCSSREPFTVFD